jgi:hypothetical protein
MTGIADVPNIDLQRAARLRLAAAEAGSFGLTSERRWI